MSAEVAIVPARGGSKRLPRKNVADLLGRPLLAWTVEAALESGCFARVIVSTEDAAIAEIARAAGAEVLARPDPLAGDRATMAQVCLHALDFLEAEGALPPAFCCLLATAALRRGADIRAARARLVPGAAEFVMATTEYAKNPLQALREDADGHLRLMWPELVDLPREERPRLVVDNGSTYWCRTDAFRRERTFYGSTLVGHPMPRERSIDIDTIEDLDLLRREAARLAGR